MFSALVISDPAAKSLLDASSRMEANSEKLLLSIDDRLAKISAGLSPLPEGQEGATTKALAEITLDLKSVVVSSDIAAKMSTDAAGHPTGWGWHLLIALLLIGVLVAQAITHMKLNSK